MNRNVESHFSQIPQANIQRSTFDRSSSHKTTFNVGDLIPIYLDEVLPGDTFDISTSKVVRLQTLLAPILDNMYLDTYWYFVPMRLVWDNWQYFAGEQKEDAWVDDTEYIIPRIKTPNNGWNVGTIADYLGIPTGVQVQDSDSPNLPSALPFRAYAKICNDWFRDENLTDPLVIPTDDNDMQGTNGATTPNPTVDVAKGGPPFKVARYHDYFSAALPSPQRGDPVEIPGTNLELPQAWLPVISRNSNNFSTYRAFPSTSFGQRVFLKSELFAEEATSANRYPVRQVGIAGSGFDERVQALKDPSSTNNDYDLYPANLYANFPKTPISTSAFTINDLRLAFGLQRFLEKSARGGSRYTELLKTHFGVTSPDARLQRTEYLGGNRIHLNIHQVTNTAQGEQDFLGDLGAMSVTTDVHSDFVHSFTEHGYLMCVCCARYDHTYSQGLDKLWTRRTFPEFYLPVFANLGEMPVMTREIYWDEDNDDVFGYQEAWAEYRYKPNRLSGEMRLDATGSLGSWHLGDYYTQAPTLSDGWIREDKTNVDRVLAVTSSVSHQVFADFYFKVRATRPMPMYSIPGLLDHN